MDLAETRKRIDACLTRAARLGDAIDPDVIDVSTADGVVTFEMADGTRFLLNRQAAVGQIWFAAGARAWHFVHDGAKDAWVDTKDGVELFERIAGVLSEKIGEKVQFPGA